MLRVYGFFYKFMALCAITKGRTMSGVMLNIATSLAENFRDSRITLEKQEIKNDALAAFYAMKASIESNSSVVVSDEKLAQICIRAGQGNNEDLTAFLSSIVWNVSYVIASIISPDEKEDVLIPKLAAEYPEAKDKIHNVISQAKISDYSNPKIEELINDPDLYEYKDEIEKETNLYYDNAIALPKYNPDTEGGLYSADKIEELISNQNSQIPVTATTDTENTNNEEDSNPVDTTIRPDIVQDKAVKDVSKKKKNAIAADVLAMFLGVFGLHDFYLGRIGCGIIKIILYFAAYMMAANLNEFGIVLGVIVDIWIIIDMVMISSNSWSSNKYELEDGRPWTYIILVIKIVIMVFSYINTFSMF